MSTLIIRAHAGPRIGTGHVMRCLALAQAWQAAGGAATFVLTSGAEVLVPRLQSEGMETVLLAAKPGSREDACATAALAREKAAAWVVVDGYCFDANYQRVVKDANFSLLFLDDNAHAAHYCADLVLNQNLHAREEMYAHCEPHTKLLLGPRYSLLRREFLRWREWKREFPEVARKLLVTMGGADPENVTAQTLGALEPLAGLEVKVAVGPANGNLTALREQARKSRRATTVVAGLVELPALMAWADLAVSSAGSTVWELCFLGLPSLLVPLAENQGRTAEELTRFGAAVRLEGSGRLRTPSFEETIRELASDPVRRGVMSERARSIVDGGGAGRVVRRLRRVGLELRRVRDEDRKLLWEWANDREARAASFSTAPIPWEEHLAWFAKKMADPSYLMFIGTDDSGVPIGQVRFELLAGSEAIVHVSIAAGQRGRGFGRALILEGVKEVRSRGAARSIHAYIKPGNEGSIHAFEQAGFHRIGTAQFSRDRALHYVFEPQEHCLQAGARH